MIYKINKFIKVYFVFMGVFLLNIRSTKVKFYDAKSNLFDSIPQKEFQFTQAKNNWTEIKWSKDQVLTLFRIVKQVIKTVGIQSCLNRIVFITLNNHNII